MAGLLPAALMALVLIAVAILFGVPPRPRHPIRGAHADRQIMGRATVTLG